MKLIEVASLRADRLCSGGGIFGFYFLLQTRWGADCVSNWVSENSGYHLTFDVMDHRFSAPSLLHWRM